MGCFNVAGTMSSCSIGCGTEVAFFLLTNNEYGRYDFNSKVIGSHLISNEGPHVFLKPFCPPIYGSYNEYGSLEDIIQNETTNALEKHFGTSIQEIVNIITDSRNKFTAELELYSEEEYLSKEKELRSLSAMFEHKEVYDHMVNKTRERNLVLESGYFTDSTMELMGFEYRGTEVNKLSGYDPKRYNKKWTKGIFTVYTDGNWKSSNIFINDAPVEVKSYDPKDLCALFGTDEYKLQISTTELAIKDFRKKTENLDEKLFDLFHDRFPVKVAEINIGTDEEYERLGMFNFAMWSTNKFYFPAHPGEQCGNAEAEKDLNDIVSVIINNNLNSRY